MKNINPKSITLPSSGLISCEWQDGYKAVMKLEKFREHCPCAECREQKKETGKKFAFSMMKTYKEGMNDLVKLKKIGNYAICPVWGDGHDIGIYDWEYLRNIFEKNALPEN